MKIDKGVPLPPPTTQAGKGRSVWRQMEPGDSIFFPARKPASFAGALAYAAHATGWKFSMRKVTEDGQDGTRVWRVK
jgi:hypothetical protein